MQGFQLGVQFVLEMAAASARTSQARKRDLSLRTVSRQLPTLQPAGEMDPVTAGDGGTTAPQHTFMGNGGDEVLGLHEGAQLDEGWSEALLKRYQAVVDKDLGRMWVSQGSLLAGIIRQGLVWEVQVGDSFILWADACLLPE